jgi:uncharacterized repeat protein (TIGR01451 family)
MNRLYVIYVKRVLLVTMTTLFTLLDGISLAQTNDENTIVSDPDEIITEMDSTVIYTIAFQNTFSDTAKSLTIVDTLDNRFSVLTYSTIDSSHPFNLVKTGQVLSWQFNGIILPDSSSDTINSKGFIKFSVDLKKVLDHNESLTNRAKMNFGVQGSILTPIDSLVGKSSISTFDLDQQIYCAGDSTWVRFSSVLAYSSGNKFTAELSDSNGDFIKPFLLGSIASTKKRDSIMVQIPGFEGSGFKLRVISSSPAAFGLTSQYSDSFKIVKLPSFTLSVSSKKICHGVKSIISSSAYPFRLIVNGKDSGLINKSFTNILLDTSYIVFAKRSKESVCFEESNTLNVEVIDTPNLTLTTKPFPPDICKGQNITYYTSGAEKYKYFLSGVQFGPETSVDSVTLISPVNGRSIYVIGNNKDYCYKQTEPLYVTVRPSPSLKLSADKNPICSGDSTGISAVGADDFHFIYNGQRDTFSSVSKIFRTPNNRDSVYVIGKIGNCIDSTEHLTFTVHPTANLDLQNTNPMCSDDTIHFTASSADLYDFHLNGNHRGTNSTGSFSIYPIKDSDTITVRGIDENFCTAWDTLVAEVFNNPAKPTINWVLGDLLSNYQYGNQWYFNQLELSGDTQSLFSPQTSGNYTVVHTDSNGCSSQPSEPFDFHLSLNKIDISKMRIYPIPFKDILSIESDRNIESVVITDAMGKTVFEEYSRDKNKIEINTSLLSSGLYYIRMNLNNLTFKYKVSKN